MSLTTSELYEIIDNTIEDGKLISIICDKEIASIVEEYMDDMGIVEMHNDLGEYIPFGKRNSSYNITIDCRDEYEYYIDFYKLNENLLCEYDDVHVIGEDLGEEFDIDTVYAEDYYIHDDMDVEEDELDEIDYVEEEKCTECCLDCEYPDEDCNMDECDCDECYGYDHEADDIRDEYCECRCGFNPNDITEQDVINEYISAILSTNGCPECVTNLVERLAGFMKSVGYNEHKKETFEKLFGEE